MKSDMEGGCTRKTPVEGAGTGNKHEFLICHERGHHWYTCMNGNPEDIAAMEAENYTFYHLVTFININYFTNLSKLSTTGAHQRKG